MERETIVDFPEGIIMRWVLLLEHLNIFMSFTIMKSLT